MPAEYDVVVTTIDRVSMKDLSLSFVKNRLLEEETKRRSFGKTNGENTPSPTAFQTQHHGKEKYVTQTRENLEIALISHVTDVGRLDTNEQTVE
jgi:hypothetical protein